MRYFLTFCALSFSLVGASHASIRVHVKTCTGGMTVSTFDAKDSSKTTPFKTRRITGPSSKVYKCRGQGKGFCKVKLSYSSMATKWVKLKKHQWLMVEKVQSGSYTQFQLTKSKTEPTCPVAN